MVNHRLLIAYDGSTYAGWQVQGDQPTIQLHLEAALRELWQAPVRVHGSGRTDAGVHARGQVAHFHAPAKFHDPGRLRQALNAHLPPTIRIRAARFAPPSFHARFSACGKEYHYRIIHGGNDSPFEVHYAWQLRRRLDADAMRRAAAPLLGEHDFASFASNPGYERETTIRTLYAIDILSRGDQLTLKFRGSGFLYRMVRNLTGALVRVGDGRLAPGALRTILASRQRAAAPPPAPACGLYLHRVYYSMKPCASQES